MTWNKQHGQTQTSPGYSWLKVCNVMTRKWPHVTRCRLWNSRYHQRLTLMLITRRGPPGNEWMAQKHKTKQVLPGARINGLLKFPCPDSQLLKMISHAIASEFDFYWVIHTFWLVSHLVNYHWTKLKIESWLFKLDFSENVQALKAENSTFLSV